MPVEDAWHLMSATTPRRVWQRSVQIQQNVTGSSGASCPRRTPGAATRPPLLDVNPTSYLRSPVPIDAGVVRS